VAGCSVILVLGDAVALPRAQPSLLNESQCSSAIAQAEFGSQTISAFMA